jgi:hypothetical protein
MQKPPEIRRLAEILDRRVLEQDGGDDQDLAGNGDDARRAGFDDTHFNFLINGSRFAPATQMAVSARFLNCKDRHRQLRFLQLSPRPNAASLFAQDHEGTKEPYNTHLAAFSQRPRFEQLR